MGVCTTITGLAVTDNVKIDDNWHSFLIVQWMQLIFASVLLVDFSSVTPTKQWHTLTSTHAPPANSTRRLPGELDRKLARSSGPKAVINVAAPTVRAVTTCINHYLL